MNSFARFVFGLAVFTLSGCGLVMDLRDAIGPTRYGPMTPDGEIKHDIWGNTFIEPYPPPKGETRQEPSEGNNRKQ